MMVFWIILVTNTHFFPMYMAARHDVELNDALLAQVRSRQSVSKCPTILAMVEPYPIVGLLLLQVYMTLVPLMTAAAVLPRAGQSV